MASNVIFDAKYLHETEKAILVEIEGQQLWIPLSQIDASSEICDGCGMKRGEAGTIVMTAWIARQKGLAVEDDDRDYHDRNYDYPYDDH